MSENVNGEQPGSAVDTAQTADNGRRIVDKQPTHDPPMGSTPGPGTVAQSPPSPGQTGDSLSPRAPSRAVSCASVRPNSIAGVICSDSCIRHQ